jgi:hypothetical protein
MPKILVIEGDKVTPLDKTKFTEEGKLQDYLEKYPSLIPLGEIVEGASDLLCIGREIIAGPGWVDLLFIDKDGLLTIVETKLAKNPEARRTVIGQIIEYASYVSQWTADDVERIANNYFKLGEVPERYRDKTLYDAMKQPGVEELSDEEIRANIENNLKDGKIRCIIAVDELVEPLRATVTFLNENSKFEILLLQVSSFEEKERDRKILAPSLFGYATKTSPSGGKPIINEDIFLACCREGEHKGAEELYFRAKALAEKRRHKGDSIRWGVSGHSYRISHVDEVVFVNYPNGWLSLWLYIVEKSGETGQRYLEKLSNIADFSSKVDDYKKHKEPSFPTDKMTSKDIDAFISAVEELGEALDAEDKT